MPDLTPGPMPGYAWVTLAGRRQLIPIPVRIEVRPDGFVWLHY